MEHTPGKQGIVVDDLEYQERAAIMEYDANLPRKRAEQMAREDLQKKEACKIPEKQ